jgi:hypothetical protein
MQTKEMVASEGTVRRYTLPMNVTPKGEGQMPRMNSQADIQRSLILRAEELAVREGYQGPGKFTPKYYRLALAERPPSERAAERGFRSSPSRELSQQSRAAKHYAEQIRTHMDKGLSRPEAISRATEEHKRSGLAQLTLPRNSPWAAAGERTQRNEVHRFAKVAGAKIGNVAVKLHAETDSPLLPTTHQEKAATEVGLLAARVAASVLARGGNTPNQIEIAWVSDWWEVNQPTPRPVPQADPRILDEYNKARLRFIEDVVQAAAAILRDPVKRNQIAPAKLW